MSSNRGDDLPHHNPYEVDESKEISMTSENDENKHTNYVNGANSKINKSIRNRSIVTPKTSSAATAVAAAQPPLNETSLDVSPLALAEKQTIEDPSVPSTKAHYSLPALKVDNNEYAVSSIRGIEEMWPHQQAQQQLHNIPPLLTSRSSDTTHASTTSPHSTTSTSSSSCSSATTGSLRSMVVRIEDDAGNSIKSMVLSIGGVVGGGGVGIDDKSYNSKIKDHVVKQNEVAVAAAAALVKERSDVEFVEASVPKIIEKLTLPVEESSLTVQKIHKEPSSSSSIGDIVAMRIIPELTPNDNEDITPLQDIFRMTKSPTSQTTRTEQQTQQVCEEKLTTSENPTNGKVEDDETSDDDDSTLNFFRNSCRFSVSNDDDSSNKNNKSSNLRDSSNDDADETSSSPTTIPNVANTNEMIFNIRRMIGRMMSNEDTDAVTSDDDDGGDDTVEEEEAAASLPLTNSSKMLTLDSIDDLYLFNEKTAETDHLSISSPTANTMATSPTFMKISKMNEDTMATAVVVNDVMPNARILIGMAPAVALKRNNNSCKTRNTTAEQSMYPSVQQFLTSSSDCNNERDITSTVVIDEMTTKLQTSMNPSVEESLTSSSECVDQQPCSTNGSADERTATIATSLYPSVLQFLMPSSDCVDEPKLTHAVIDDTTAESPSETPKTPCGDSDHTNECVDQQPRSTNGSADERISTIAMSLYPSVLQFLMSSSDCVDEPKLINAVVDYTTATSPSETPMAPFGDSDHNTVDESEAVDGETMMSSLYPAVLEFLTESARPIREVDTRSAAIIEEDNLCPVYDEPTPVDEDTPIKPSLESISSNGKDYSHDADASTVMTLPSGGEPNSNKTAIVLTNALAKGLEHDDSIAAMNNNVLPPITGVDEVTESDNASEHHVVGDVEQSLTTSHIDVETVGIEEANPVTNASSDNPQGYVVDVTTTAIATIDQGLNDDALNTPVDLSMGPFYHAVYVALHFNDERYDNGDKENDANCKQPLLAMDEEERQEAGTISDIYTSTDENNVQPEADMDTDTFVNLTKALDDPISTTIIEEIDDSRPTTTRLLQEYPPCTELSVNDHQTTSISSPPTKTHNQVTNGETTPHFTKSPELSNSIMPIVSFPSYDDSSSSSSSSANSSIEHNSHDHLILTHDITSHEKQRALINNDTTVLAPLLASFHHNNNDDNNDDDDNHYEYIPYDPKEAAAAAVLDVPQQTPFPAGELIMASSDLRLDVDNVVMLRSSPMGADGDDDDDNDELVGVSGGKSRYNDNGADLDMVDKDRDDDSSYSSRSDYDDDDDDDDAFGYGELTNESSDDEDIYNAENDLPSIGIDTNNNPLPFETIATTSYQEFRPNFILHAIPNSHLDVDYISTIRTPDSDHVTRHWEAPSTTATNVAELPLLSRVNDECIEDTTTTHLINDGHNNIDDGNTTSSYEMDDCSSAACEQDDDVDDGTYQENIIGKEIMRRRELLLLNNEDAPSDENSGDGDVITTLDKVISTSASDGNDDDTSFHSNDVKADKDNSEMSDDTSSDISSDDYVTNEQINTSIDALLKSFAGVKAMTEAFTEELTKTSRPSSLPVTSPIVSKRLPSSQSGSNSNIEKTTSRTVVVGDMNNVEEQTLSALTTMVEVNDIARTAQKINQLIESSNPLSTTSSSSMCQSSAGNVVAEQQKQQTPHNESDYSNEENNIAAEDTTTNNKSSSWKVNEYTNDDRVLLSSLKKVSSQTASQTQSKSGIPMQDVELLASLKRVSSKKTSVTSTTVRTTTTVSDRSWMSRHDQHVSSTVSELYSPIERKSTVVSSDVSQTSNSNSSTNNNNGDVPAPSPPQKQEQLTHNSTTNNSTLLWMSISQGGKPMQPSPLISKSAAATKQKSSTTTTAQQDQQQQHSKIPECDRELLTSLRRVSQSSAVYTTTTTDDDAEMKDEENNNMASSSMPSMAPDVVLPNVTSIVIPEDDESSSITPTTFSTMMMKHLSPTTPTPCLSNTPRLSTAPRLSITPRVSTTPGSTATTTTTTPRHTATPRSTTTTPRSVATNPRSTPATTTQMRLSTTPRTSDAIKLKIAALGSHPDDDDDDTDGSASKGGCFQQHYVYISGGAHKESCYDLSILGTPTPRCEELKRRLELDDKLDEQQQQRSDTRPTAAAHAAAEAAAAITQTPTKTIIPGPSSKKVIYANYAKAAANKQSSARAAAAAAAAAAMISDPSGNKTHSPSAVPFQMKMGLWEERVLRNSPGTTMSVGTRGPDSMRSSCPSRIAITTTCFPFDHDSCHGDDEQSSSPCNTDYNADVSHANFSHTDVNYTSVDLSTTMTTTTNNRDDDDDDETAPATPPPSSHRDGLTHSPLFAASPSPTSSVMNACGIIHVRASRKTLLLKQWSEYFWVRCGITTLYLFRCAVDYTDWLRNPMLSAKQRDYLVKFKFDFYDGKKKKKMRGYKMTDVKNKAYSKKGPKLNHFKLERWTDNGHKIAIAFASKEMAEIERLRLVISDCLSKCPYERASKLVR